MTKPVRAVCAALALLCAAALVSCAKRDGGQFGADGLSTGRGAVIMGTTGETYVKNNLPDAQAFVYTSETDAAAALLAGKADCIMLGTCAANVMAGTIDGLRILPEVYQTEKIAMALNKDDRSLLNSINAVLYEYRESGRLARITSHWLKEAGEEYDYTRTPKRGDDAPVLLVGTTGDLEPTSFVKDGVMVGLDSELIENVAYDLGYRVEYAVMDFDALLPALVSKKIDVAASDLTVTEERAERVSFTDTCYTDEQVLVVRDGSAAAAGRSQTSLADTFVNSFVKEGRWKLIARGLGVTVVISLLSALLGTLLALALTAMRRSDKKALSGFAGAFVAAVQGTPVVVLLLIVCYIIFAWASIGSWAVAVIAFAVYFSAYACEIMIAGLNSVDKGQREAALALGYTRWGALRRVVLPQAARFSLPLYKQELVSLVKTTSVAGYIAIEDLTKAGDIIRSRTYEAFFPLIMVAALYFLITWLISLALGSVEIKLDPRRRRDRRRVQGARERDEAGRGSR